MLRKIRLFVSPRLAVNAPVESESTVRAVHWNDLAVTPAGKVMEEGKFPIFVPDRLTVAPLGPGSWLKRTTAVVVPPLDTEVGEKRSEEIVRG